MLDLNRLRVLRAVVASASVNDTARRLGYTPSTISQHIHTLEREVGFPLVERVGRGIRPTPAGIELANHAEAALNAVADLEARARELKQGTTRRLTMRSFASAAYTWMPRVARALRREFPGLTIELSIGEADSPDTYGQADVEVHTEVPFVDPVIPPGYTRIELGIDDFLVAVPVEHPLSRAGSADLADFATDDWIEYDFRDDIALQLSAHACASAGFTPRYVARAQDHVTGLAFVAAGVGIGLVPQLALGWSAFEVAYVHPLNPTPQRRIIALVRDSVRANPAALRTVELLAESGRQLGHYTDPAAPRNQN